VGDASAAAARAAGFTRVESAGGDVEDLARLVGARLDPKGGPLFHGAGSAVAGDLAGLLAGAGFDLRRSVIYEAIPSERLTAGTVDALAERAFDFVLLFSPRTAATFGSLVRAAGETAVDGCRHAAALCLSPAVAQAAEELKWRSVRVAQRPDMPAMLALVAQCLEEMEKPAPSESAAPVEANMSDGKEGTSAAPAPEAPVQVPGPPPSRRGGWATVAVAAMTAAVVAGAVGALWPKPAPLGETARPSAAGPDPAVIARLDDADTRIAAAKLAADAAAGRVDELSGAVTAIKEQLASLGTAESTSAGPASSDIAALRDRLAGLEQQLIEIASLGTRVTSLGQELAALRTQQSTVAQGASIDGAALERLTDENERLQSEIATLKSQVEPLGDLTARINALDLAVKANAVGSANSALALAIGQFNSALAAGRPYSAELAALRNVTAGDSDMAAELEGIAGPLEEFATIGIPTVPELRDRFAQVASTIARLGTKSTLTEITGAEPSGSWLDRTLDRLSAVIVVRPVGEVPGDSPNAHVARAEALLQAGDIDGAINEVGGLSGEAAEVAAVWLTAAKARQSADQMIAGLQLAAIARFRPAEPAPSSTGG
jgi:hypothetical protein